MRKKLLFCLLLLTIGIRGAWAVAYGCLGDGNKFPSLNSRCGSYIFGDLDDGKPYLQYTYPYWQIRSLFHGIVLAGYAICQNAGSSGIMCYCRQLFPYFNTAAEWQTGSYSGCYFNTATWSDMAGCQSECAKACLLTIPDENITWGYKDSEANYELTNILQYTQFYK